MSNMLKTIPTYILVISPLKTEYLTNNTKKSSGRTSKATYYPSITKTNRLMLLTEIIAHWILHITHAECGFPTVCLSGVNTTGLKSVN
jgi:hypothetical protein